MTAQPTGSPIALMPDAAAAVTAVAEQVPAGAWSRPSPCTEWTVADVLAHLTREHLWAPHLLRGETVEQVGSRYEGDVLGDDPVAAWKRAAAGSMMAWGQASDPEAEVSVSWGAIPVREYAHQMLTDLTVHGWDIARGAAVDPQADADAIEVAWAYQKPMAGGGSALFAAPVATDSSDRLDQLAALLGRDPSWRPPLD
ncbi:TIGR03086 family metal-binding protein [Ornithinicoccus halotolerans]|uniref:TIGR03086 family metal-binding protein n=1 Tax=Ornithinicoccus halotolerans TaxID=1748220 RepID=UPI001296E52F|nr:TIGR03086 family metal-binding protein [Ornithinicoccus halotolerans]